MVGSGGGRGGGWRKGDVGAWKGCGVEVLEQKKLVRSPPNRQRDQDSEHKALGSKVAEYACVSIFCLYIRTCFVM